MKKCAPIHSPYAIVFIVRAWTESNLLAKCYCINCLRPALVSCAVLCCAVCVYQSVASSCDMPLLRCVVFVFNWIQYLFRYKLLRSAFDSQNAHNSCRPIGYSIFGSSVSVCWYRVACMEHTSRSNISSLCHACVYILFVYAGMQFDAVESSWKLQRAWGASREASIHR